MNRQPQRLPCSYRFPSEAAQQQRYHQEEGIQRQLRAFNIRSEKFGRHCALSSTRVRCLRLHQRAK
eukprot:5332985-Pleurochrysis_carterae.AAC.1